MRAEKDEERSLHLAEEIHEFLIRKSYGTPDDEIIALGRVLEARVSGLPVEQRDAWFDRIVDAFKVAREDCAAESRS